MFKESYGTPHVEEKMTGDKAEREMGGEQSTQGYVEYYKNEHFEERVNKITEELIKQGIIEKLRKYYPEQTEGVWFETVKKMVRKTFLQTKIVKEEYEDQKKHHKSLSVPSMIAEEIKLKGIPLNPAVAQIMYMATLNKQKDLDKYSEGIVTPLTSSLYRKLLSGLESLKSIYPNAKFKVEYFTATLDDSNRLTYLDAFEGIDAFIQIKELETGFVRYEFIDYTINPVKTDRIGIDKGIRVTQSEVTKSNRGEKKQTIYLQSSDVLDEQKLIQAGRIAGENMLTDIKQAYSNFVEREKAA